MADAKKKDAGFTASVTSPFKGCPDGEVHPRAFNEGDVIEGNLARSMVEAKMAKPLKNKAAQPAVENKAEPNVPLDSKATKPSSASRQGQAKKAKTSTPAKTAKK